jgi:hypothetical protein
MQQFKLLKRKRKYFLVKYSKISINNLLWLLFLNVWGKSIQAFHWIMIKWINKSSISSISSQLRIIINHNLSFLERLKIVVKIFLCPSLNIKYIENLDRRKEFLESIVIVIYGSSYLPFTHFIVNIKDWICRISSIHNVWKSLNSQKDQSRILTYQYWLSGNLIST